MYDQPTLGLEEAMRALLTALEAGTKAGSPIVVAIVDHQGNLVCFARQDRCLEIAKEMALRKAYTAAIGRRDSGEYAKFMRESGRTVEQQLGPRGVSAGGGIAIKRSGDGLCLGAVGVSGAPTAEQDEEIGRAALRAMGL
jgi:glc operon protein GlcG